MKITKLLLLFFMLIIVCSNSYGQEKANPWQFRLRGISVMPAESSTDITAIGGKATVGNSVVPELDITYFINKNLAAEIILGVTPHDIGAEGTAVGDLDLGSVWLLPPTINLQYHFLPDNNIKPYAGVGINYTIFFGVDEGSTATDVRYTNNVGFSLQGGCDVALGSNYGLNLDVKKLFLGTDVEVDALDTTVSTEVDINPLIIGLGVYYKL